MKSNIKRALIVLSSVFAVFTITGCFSLLGIGSYVPVNVTLINETEKTLYAAIEFNSKTTNIVTIGPEAQETLSVSVYQADVPSSQKVTLAATFQQTVVDITLISKFDHVNDESAGERFITRSRMEAESFPPGCSILEFKPSINRKNGSFARQYVYVFEGDHDTPDLYPYH